MYDRTARVGYVVKKFPRLSETFILNEVLGLERHGVELTIASLRLPDEGRFHAAVAELAADVVYLPQFGRETVGQAFDDLARYPAATALASARQLAGDRSVDLLIQAARLAAVVDARGIGHLHAHFMTGAAHVAYLAHLLTGVPFTVTAHAKDIYRQGVDWRVWSTIAHAAEAIVTVCDANCDFIEARVPEARIVRVYNGVEPLAAGGPGSVAREPNLVVGVGRLVEKKGFGDLLRALAEPCAAAARLVLIGDGDQRAALEAEATRLGLDGRVHFTGALAQHQVHDWMRRAHVLAAPCVRGDDGNQDALPTVLLEALAHGLPVVSTPVGGIPEIVDDGVQGLLVPEGDTAALAGAIARLTSDNALWRRCSAAALARAADRFDRDRNLRELIELVQPRTPVYA